MNRMNLPPPFEEMEIEFPLLKEVYKNLFGVQEMPQKELRQNKELEEEESEIESEEEPSIKIQNIFPMKRKMQSSTKRLKIPKFVNPKKQFSTPSTHKPLRPEDLFESVPKSEPKKVELKIVSSLPTAESGSFHVSEDKQEGGFGLIFPANKSMDKSLANSETVLEERQEFITSEQLASNKISAKGGHNILFKLIIILNYTHGSCGKASVRMTLDGVFPPPPQDIKTSKICIMGRHPNSRLK